MRKLVSESLSGTSTVAVAVGVERHARLPEQQRVEQLARRLPAAAAALRQRLQAEVALADHLHLRRRRLARRSRAGPSSRRADSSSGSAASSSRPSSTAATATSLPAGGAAPSAVRTAIAHAARARAPGRPARSARHRDLQLVGAPADLDLGDAELEGGPAEVDERRRLHVADAAAHGERRDEDVRRVARPSTGTSITGSLPRERARRARRARPRARR